MDKPTPSTSVRHNDGLSEALINSYSRWMDGDTFQQSTVEEEGIPALKKREDLDDGTTKDPKANAGPPDPAANLRTGQGMKYSLGAEIRDTTKVVTREETEDLEEKNGLYANIHAKKKRGEAPAKKGSKDYPAADAFTKSAKTAKKEEVSFELNGETYIFEREILGEGMKAARDNVGASTCWKGYKAKGTKNKGGKEVPNCVKEYFEKDPKSGKMIKKHNCAKKCKKEGLEYDVIPGEHTMLEDGTVTHYDIVRENTILHNVPVEELEIMISEVHEHVVNDTKNLEVLGEKKLDAVGKEDKDIDNDGDHDKSDKYLLARRKKVGKILAAKGKASKK